MCVTQNELKTPRPCKDFLLWVEKKIENIANCETGKGTIRFRRGLAKQLVEEAMPIGIFAEHHFGHTDNVIIQCVIGSQNYDAQIFDKRSDQPALSYLEVTQSHDGEDEISRMRKLSECGHVSAVGEICKRGTNATGIKINVKEEAVSHDDVLEHTFTLCRDAIERKACKLYPEGTALVVVFDDYLLGSKGVDAKTLRAYINPVIARLDNFRLVALIGWSKRTYIAFDCR